MASFDVECEKINLLIQQRAEEAFNSSGECINPFVSLEYFPPRTDKGVENLRERLKRMKMVDPLFVDFTWGAGGSTADVTLGLTIDCKKEYGINPNMHLTCTNMPVEQIDTALASCKANGIRNICALRGDPPHGQEEWKAMDKGFQCARDLVKYIRQEYGDYFCVSVAGYPEGHPDRIKEVIGGFDSLSESEKTRCSTHPDSDGKEVLYVCDDENFQIELDYLKGKVDAGADLILTQMFFDTKVFDVFVKACRAHGINVPILPGIMCINAYHGFKRMGGFCKTRVPADLAARMEELKDDEAATKVFGVQYGAQMCRDLMSFGAPGFHFYTLNLEKVTIGILKELGLAGRYDLKEKEEDTAQMLNMIKSSKEKADPSAEPVAEVAPHDSVKIVA